MRKGFTVFELVIVVVIVGILLTLGFVSYTRWNKKVSVEKDTRVIYTVINKERMRAISEGKSFKVTATDEELVIEDLTSGTSRVVPLSNPFSGEIDIYQKGIMSKNSIVFQGDLNLNPDVSCVTSDGLRLRMGKTYINSKGKRECK